MISLNLINPVEKKVVAKELLVLMFRNIVSMFLIVVILIGVMFMICRIYLQTNYHQIVAQGTAVTLENKWINEEIKVLNNDLKTANKVQAGFFKWSQFLVDFFELVPEGNQITSLYFDMTNRKMQMSGKSLHRDNLLRLKENLEKSDLFTDLDSPLSNLLSRENINFNFSASIK